MLNFHLTHELLLDYIERTLVYLDSEIDPLDNSHWQDQVLEKETQMVLFKLIELEMIQIKLDDGFLFLRLS